ncbi:MAG: NADH-quinone oxidoreductase subunit NuoE [Beijerinckiaceae bacterium]|jgi:NADH-quinone oxidoreductase subunit E|nr:NADH-quinone oxidoreductase subunit NuoE [Beijerinckiaceae bacterium]
MSVRRLAPDAVQPKTFAFSKTNDNWADGQIAKYPKGREASAVIPLLWMAQEQAGGWLPQKAIEAVGRKLGMPYMRVFEIATFYTMFNLQPVGEHFVQVCGTVPCHLKGAREIIKVCEDKIGPQSTVSSDGKLSWLEVECLGACCNAPMVQINYDYYEDLTPENFAALLDNLRTGKPVKTGPQVDRSCSEPLGGGDTLKDKALYDGSAVGRGDWQSRVKAEREAARKAAEAAEAAKAAAAAMAAATPAAATPPAPAPVATPAPLASAGGEKGRAAPAAKSAKAGEPASAVKPVAPPPSHKARESKSTAVDAAAPKPAEAEAPALLAKPRSGKGDDLKLIWGVGPKLEKLLNSLGVWHFDQIAVWTPKELAWIDSRMEGFKGRAVRDGWIGQSQKLATGWRPDNAVGDKPKGK